MNIVYIMTDTQRKDMVGAYGNSEMDTPSLDQLADEGMRFERAYTACPLCTPARSAIFTGVHPMVNGSWCNNTPVYPTVPLMGSIFRRFGYRAGYTGKWHLDASGYFGDGVPGGGFEPDWWYDGKCYADDIGPEKFAAYKNAPSMGSAGLRTFGFFNDANNIWGHRVADQAIDFLEQVGDEPFALCVSFDEPHGPFVCPPEYWEKFESAESGQSSCEVDSFEGKPSMQNLQREEALKFNKHSNAKLLGCNSYIDREIGRVIEAVDRHHKSDTIIIYTSDHGDMFDAHGLRSKGPMMYEEITNVPFIVRMPGGPSGVVSDSLVSHLDILPTMLDYAGIERPESLHGLSLRPVLEQTASSVRDTALVSFNRFAINHDGMGGFYPIRCMTDGRFKLSLNLLDTDEFYDLSEDPHEQRNAIDDPLHEDTRARMHELILEEMGRIRDPFRSRYWEQRHWRSANQRTGYFNMPERPAPEGFNLNS